MTKARLLVPALALLSLAANANAAVKICRAQGVDIFVDNGGTTPVSDGFNKCVRDLTVTEINLPPGLYRVDKPIIVKDRNDPAQRLTIRTAGLAGNIRNCQQLGDAACAVFFATEAADACLNNPTFAICRDSLVQDGGGLLQARSSKRIIFDHLVIDGNHAARTGTASAVTYCQNKTQNIPDQARWGFNAQMVDCGGTTLEERCEFTYNNTREALCGTGLRWKGDFGRVQGNAAIANGEHTPLLWADGLTIHTNNNGKVNDNHLVNNTDVGLIFGAAMNTEIRSNWIQQNGVYAFAALMLGNFAEADPVNHPSGNYTGATVKYNTIQCYSFSCGFGINFGPDPWTKPAQGDLPNVTGGTVTQNTISGARVLINFGGYGVGRLNAPVVTGNTLTKPAMGKPVADNSTCVAMANVVANLPSNETRGQECDNWVVTDLAPTSSKCFKNCF